jgi:hypothetical protein
VRIRAAPSAADIQSVTVSVAGAAGTVQIAVLARVLDQARPVPAATPADAVMQAAASHALLATAATLDVRA